MVKAFFPDATLAPFVSGFLAADGQFDKEAQMVFGARGVPMLVFPYCQPSRTTYKYGISGSGYLKPQMDEPALLTPAHEFAQVSFSGPIHFVMVMLKTTGAYHFMRSKVQGLAHQSLTLDTLGLNSYFSELQDRLWAVGKPGQAVVLIQEYLCRYFCQKVRIGPGDFAPVMNYMLRHPGGLSVQDLSKKFRCSERWIEKQCAVQTGLSPKSWLRLIRFRAASNYWLKRPNASWMELVARFNYTDQSHLIRDFRDFTGSPPANHFAQYSGIEVGFKQHEAGLSRLLDG